MAQPQRVATRQRVNSCRLADYRYVKDRAVAVYQQSTAPALAHAAELRAETPGAFTSYDLDMGFKFASIPRILYIQMQQLGITDDTPAMIKFLQAHQALTGDNYFCTTKRLL